jgi:hypothetical protein
MTMYRIIITCTAPYTDVLADALEAHYADRDEAEILSTGISFTRREGTILLSWDGTLDLALLHQLSADSQIIDYTLLEIASLVEAAPYEEETLGRLYGPTIYPVRGE